MLLACLVLGLVQADFRPGDFFPTVEGCVWTYEEKAGKSAILIEDRCGAPVKQGDRLLTPFSSSIEGAKSDTIYYDVGENQVLAVAVDLAKPFPKPYPVLKGPNTSWTFEGQTDVMGDFVPITMKGSVGAIKTKDVLGRQVRCLEVTLDIVIDASLPGVSKLKITSHQVSTYAEGIGLVEMKETGNDGRKKIDRSRKLTAFKPRQGGSSG